MLPLALRGSLLRGFTPHSQRQLAAVSLPCDDTRYGRTLAYRNKLWDKLYRRLAKHPCRVSSARNVQFGSFDAETSCADHTAGERHNSAVVGPCEQSKHAQLLAGTAHVARRA